jgi:tetratricopeptide (TPR) repeat protein/predicted MPP superfamily phosphohydrolase
MKENSGAEFNDFTWLHLSDLHVGMQSQDWLWPTLKTALFQDLNNIHSRTGDWDVVIFSGDLTQRGAREEFEKLDTILHDLWKQFRQSGFSPSLLVLPGNHDVKRPKELSPGLRVLKKWWEESEIHDEFFALASSPYRIAVNELLSEYQRWHRRFAKTDIDLLHGGTGHLPGDTSTVFKKGALSVGLVGLNSTWLQLDGADYLGKLHVDARQLMAVTGNDPDAWCEANDFNLLITHHPTEWLHKESQSLWRSDVSPSGRFDAHLFGHMHEPITNSSSTSGSPTAHSIQAASLFGLTYTDGKVDRIHGYSLGRLRKSPTADELKVWPRRLQNKSSGNRLLGPDTSFTLDEADNSYILFSRANSNEPALFPKDEIVEQSSTSLAVFPTLNVAEETLRKIRYHLPQLSAHQNVRWMEQQQCLEMLTDSRAVWIVSEWGMGEDGFLSSIRQKRGEANRPVYRIDLSDYVDRDQLFTSFKRKLDCSLERFCELISNTGPNSLLLDNVPVNPLCEEGVVTAESDLEEVVSIMLEYCSQLTIFLRTRRAPRFHSIPLVELKPLDQADLKTYVTEHEKGGSDVATPNNISALKRHTDGIPARVDQSLRHLEVVPLSELINSNADISANSIETANVPPGLSIAIADLAASTEPFLQRTFSLLKALTIFPQGEQMVRIKRFLLNAPFFPAHAAELRDRSLIEVSTVQRIDLTGPTESEKTLIVPRPVRECVRSTMDYPEVQDLNRRAANLYFGPNWASGTLKMPTAYRFNNPHCSASDIANASTIIVRLFKDAQAEDDEHSMSRTLGLANSFMAALSSGGHFQSGVTLGNDLLPLLSDHQFEDKRATLQSHHGKCLRMIGSHDQAKETLLEISEYPFPSHIRQGVLLNLALCYQSLNQTDLAIETAQRVIAIDRHSNPGLQARGLIVELNLSDPRREEKLVAIERLCRRNNADIAANNIALLRAEEASGEPGKMRQILTPVIRTTGETKDYYNRIRAVIELTNLSLDAGQQLSEADLSHLVGSYHFLFNERIAGLFDKCHDALWKSFTTANDKENLLRLFRLSSFYWRLRGNKTREQRYLVKLTDTIANDVPDKVGQLNREVAYYKMRVSAVALIESRE